MDKVFYIFPGGILFLSLLLLLDGGDGKYVHTIRNLILYALTIFFIYCIFFSLESQHAPH